MGKLDIDLFLGKENCPMKKRKLYLYLFLVVVCLVYYQGNGLAETMYVTDRLYLSLRNAPDPEKPSLTLLSSDTPVDVLETEGNWAHVKLEDGRAGWVMKRFLVKELPKSLIIEQLKKQVEQLKGQVEEKNIIPERLRKENASLKEEIDTLKSEIMQQSKRIEGTTKENTLKRLKEIYATGIVALLGGIVIGYLVRRPKKARY
jgi:SH3 domain protein